MVSVVVVVIGVVKSADFWVVDRWVAAIEVVE